MGVGGGAGATTCLECDLTRSMRGGMSFAIWGSMTRRAERQTGRTGDRGTGRQLERKKTRDRAGLRFPPFSRRVCLVARVCQRAFLK